MVEVSTSLLSIDEEKCIQTIYDLEVAGTNSFHIDVMDGKFVKNNTTEKMRKYTEYIKQVSNTKIDVHLMVEDVESYINSYIDMGVNSITFHVESVKNEKKVLELISYIKHNNIQVGLTIKPNTPVQKIYPYLPYIHSVMIMSVEPGEGAQKFIESSLSKIQELNIYAYENGYDIDIAVDGGINDETAKSVKNSGANILVAGSYIIKSNDYKEAIRSLKEK